MTMNVEFCGDNSRRSKKISYFRKYAGGVGGGGGGGLPGPLSSIRHCTHTHTHTYFKPNLSKSILFSHHHGSRRWLGRTAKGVQN